MKFKFRCCAIFWVMMCMNCISLVSSPEPELERVCGSCDQLQTLVNRLTPNSITMLADRQQASGDQISGSRTMCGGICSGLLILDGGSFSNLGVLLKEQGLIASAMACYRIAQRLQPSVAGHHYRMCAPPRKPCLPLLRLPAAAIDALAPFCRRAGGTRSWH